MRVVTTLLAVVLISAGCHNKTDTGAPAPTTCDPSVSTCPTTPPPGDTGAGQTPPTSTPTNPPPSTTPPAPPTRA
jgi:hypothetical protein